MVEGRELRLAQPLDGGQHAGVNDPHAQIGVGALQLDTALQVGSGRMLNPIRAVEHVSQKAKPDIARQAFMAPVVKLAQHQCRDDEFFIGLREQLRAGSVIGVRCIERRQ